MLGGAIIISCVIVGLIFFLTMAERVVTIQNQEAIIIEKLHPASYRKVENRFKDVKEDFSVKKYLYEKKEMKMMINKKKNRRPHVRSRYKEDERKELEEEKFMTQGGSADNSGEVVSRENSQVL